MGEITTIAFEDALQRVPNFYKPSLTYLYQSALFPGEEVLFVGVSTKHIVTSEQQWSSFLSEWKEKLTYSNTSSLIVLTNQRWIRKGTSWSTEKGLLFSNKDEKEHWFKAFKTGFRWAEPRQDRPPNKTSSDRQGKSVEEWARSDIVFLPLKQIQASNAAVRFTNQDNVQQKYLMISINDDYFSLPIEDGEQLFQLLQEATLNDGMIPLGGERAQVPNTPDDNVLQRLQQLNKLLESELITSEEYQKKREEILAML